MLIILHTTFMSAAMFTIPLTAPCMMGTVNNVNSLLNCDFQIFLFFSPMLIMHLELLTMYCIISSASDTHGKKYNAFIW